MQKNWYVLYTKPQCEKKVASLLLKKKVEYFIPFIGAQTQRSWRSKIVYKPLFKSYVFAHVTEHEAVLLAQAEGVISLLHWLGKPAVINETEINAMKEFVGDYQDINLEKLAVNSNVAERNVYSSSYEIEGNILAVKNKTIKISLPSLGYAMVAKLQDDGFFAKEISMSQNYIFAQS